MRHSTKPRTYGDFLGISSKKVAKLRRAYKRFSPVSAQQIQSLCEVLRIPATTISACFRVWDYAGKLFSFCDIKLSNHSQCHCYREIALHEATRPGGGFGRLYFVEDGNECILVLPMGSFVNGFCQWILSMDLVNGDQSLCY